MISTTRGLVFLNLAAAVALTLNPCGGGSISHCGQGCVFALGFFGFYLRHGS
jgi:hypothetical protein